MREKDQLFSTTRTIFKLIPTTKETNNIGMWVLEKKIAGFWIWTFAKVNFGFNNNNSAIHIECASQQKYSGIFYSWTSRVK